MIDYKLEDLKLVFSVFKLSFNSLGSSEDSLHNLWDFSEF